MLPTPFWLPDLELTWIAVDKPIRLWGAGGKSYGGAGTCAWE